MNKFYQPKIINKLFQSFKHLPTPVFITAVDGGTFIDMNKAAKDFFCIPADAKPSEYSIISYYLNSEDRDYILKSLNNVYNKNKANEDENWDIKKSLVLDIKGIRKTLRFYAKPFGDKNNKFIGSLCVTYQVTEIDKFHVFEDEITSGVFELGRNLQLVYSNKSFKKIINLNNAKDVFFKDLFEKIDEYNTLVDYIENNAQKEIIHKSHCVLRTLSGRPVLGNLVIQPQFNNDGKWIKARAIFRDLTYSEIVKNAPIGIYLIMKVEDEDIIIKANQHFINILDFKTECIISFKVYH